MRGIARIPLLRILVVLLSFAGASVATQARADGRWCISSDTVLFGNHAVGSNTTSNVTVTNCGEQSWSFTDVSVHPATGPAFNVSTTCAPGMALAPGKTCLVTVSFAPQAPGETSGGLWLRNTTSTLNQLLTFYGRGIDARVGTARLAFIPGTAVFDAQAIGAQSAALTVELHNLGPSDLTPTAMVLNGPEVYDFSGYPVTCQVGTPIPAGGSCSVALSFQPQAAGMRRANLVIDAPQLASLTILHISGVGGAAAPAPSTPAPEAIPTTSRESLVLLALALAALGWAAMRKRRGR